jgi:rhodanese-related sulfurtransferase
MILRMSPEQVQQCGHNVVDVREFPEYAAGAIHGSSLVPLVTVEREAAQWNKQEPVVLVCRGGKRAAQAAGILERMGFVHVAILDGGMEGWQRAGLPVGTSERKPWSLERQVRVIAGSLVLLLTILGLTVSRWLFAGTLFVGGGLLFAGVTDLCLMATLLGRMPWNRASQCQR